MAALTLDHLLTEAGTLPADEQELLETLLHKRRVEAWCVETATEAKSTVAAFRSGKLKAQSAESVIARLHNAKLTATN